MKNPFIEQTAIDYELPYHIVESIYDKYNSKGLFYEMLEEKLKENV